MADRSASLKPLSSFLLFLGAGDVEWEEEEEGKRENLEWLEEGERENEFPRNFLLPPGDLFGCSCFPLLNSSVSLLKSSISCLRQP